jgi:hypothetical protein
MIKRPAIGYFVPPPLPVPLPLLYPHAHKHAAIEITIPSLNIAFIPFSPDAAL